MTDNLQLSDGEKIILVMLADIQEALKVRGTFNAPLIREAVLGGDLWAIDSEYRNSIGLVETRDPAIKTQVFDILEMWSTLEEQFASLSKDDQQAISPNGTFGFLGFDSRDESDHYHVARFIIEHMGRFTRLKGRQFASGYPTLPRHRKTLDVYLPLRPMLAERNFTVDEVAAIVSR